MNAYLQSCDPFEHNLFIKLIQGVDTLYNKLCKNTIFASNFKKHYNCLHKFKDVFARCNGPDDWTEIKNNEIICK